MRPAVGTALAVLIAAATGVGAAVINRGDHHADAHPAPTPSASPAVWIQRLDDARTALESTTTAIHAAAVTGQNLADHQHNCRTAVDQFNAAAAHLNTTPLDPSTECKP